MRYPTIIKELLRLEQVENDLLLAAQEEAAAQGDMKTEEKLMQFRRERKLIDTDLPHTLGARR